MSFYRVLLSSILIMLSTSLNTARAIENIDYNLIYKINWGGTYLGSATAKWKMDDTSYQFEGFVKSEGSLSFLYEFEGKNTLTGERVNGTYKPSEFTSESNYDDEVYKVDMSWPRGIQTPIYTVEPEVKQREVHPLRKATLRNVVDPYTAMLLALEDLEKNGLCDGKYRVFDGRRRSELLLKDLGTTILSAEEDGQYAGEAHICGSASKLLGGHKLDSDYDPDEELDFEKVKIFVGKINGDTLMPVRIEMSGLLGSISANLDMTSSSFD